MTVFTAFLRFCMVTWGLTFLVTGSGLGEPWRRGLAELLPGGLGLGAYCAPCVGGWVGLAMGAAGLWPWPGGLALLEPFVAGVGLGALFAHYVPAPPQDLLDELPKENGT